MKKYGIIICILLLTTLALAQDDYESVFPNVSLEGKSSAMGSVNLLDSPDTYAGNKKIKFEMGKKEQLGIIPYSYYKFDFKSYSMKIVTSEDILKTTKIGIGKGFKFKKLNLGMDFNIFTAEVVDQKSGSYEIQAEANKEGITNEDLKGTTAKGVGIDLAFSVDLNENLKIGYYMENLGAKLKWDINGETSEEELDKKKTFGVIYKKDNMTLCSEIEDFEKLNLGIQRNYYEKLDLRAGISRNFDTSENIEAQKLYSVGIGFVPGEIKIRGRKIQVGIDVGYQMKYFGDNDIFNGDSEDDIAFSTYIRY